MKIKSILFPPNGFLVQYFSEPFEFIPRRKRGLDPELALLEPNTEIMQCSICDAVIWKHSTAQPITTRISMPSHLSTDRAATMSAVEMLHQVSHEMHLQTVVMPAEEAARSHFAEKHRLRLWLWERYGWDRLLKKWLR